MEPLVKEAGKPRLERNSKDVVEDEEPRTMVLFIVVPCVPR